jgi:hypothetical protein
VAADLGLGGAIGEQHGEAVRTVGAGQHALGVVRRDRVVAAVLGGLGRQPPGGRGGGGGRAGADEVQRHARRHRLAREPAKLLAAFAVGRHQRQDGACERSDRLGAAGHHHVPDRQDGEAGLAGLRRRRGAADDGRVGRVHRHHGEQRAADQGEDQAEGDQGDDRSRAAEGAGTVKRLHQPQQPLPSALDAHLPPVGEHVTFELPRVIGDHDVHRGQAAIIPLRLAGEAQPAPLLLWPQPRTFSSSMGQLRP